MTRDDLKKFRTLGIDFSTIGLEQPSVETVTYFCTPLGAEDVGWTGCDGVHFILLPEDERVFCVDPAMGEPGSYVLPVAENFREFMSFVLFCRDANPLSQIWWMPEERFRRMLCDDAGAHWPGCEAYFSRKAQALEAVAEAFDLQPADPYLKIKALQAAFDPSCLVFSDEYYDVLGLERGGT